jgi:hypothetical protein
VSGLRQKCFDRFTSACRANVTAGAGEFTENIILEISSLEAHWPKQERWQMRTVTFLYKRL